MRAGRGGDEDGATAAPERPTPGEWVRAGVRSVYQPIVDLHSRQTVGYEALARGARHLSGLSPYELFGRARADGVEAELDWECRSAAFAGALAARLPAQLPLFVNVEPRWLNAPCPEHLRAVSAQARSRLRVVVELTERALVADPAGLLAAVSRIREWGWGIALDDVGADPGSLALMPFIEPDVIKLDLRLVQRRTDAELASIANAVTAQAERSGAVVLAEGIETEGHLHRALALGATLGQGWLLGRPDALPDRPPPPLRGQDFPFYRPDLPRPPTPFAAVEGTLPLRVATKDLLLPMSHHLEGYALSSAEPPVMLGAFEQARYFTPATRARYERLAPRCSFVAALGAGMASDPAPGVRGADLPVTDTLRGEWVVTVVDPYFAGALIAHDLRGEALDPGLPDRLRRFAFTVTHERELVLRAARSLLSRVAPLHERRD